MRVRAGDGDIHVAVDAQAVDHALPAVDELNLVQQQIPMARLGRALRNGFVELLRGEVGEFV